MDILSLIRSNVNDLQPYSTARDEYKGDSAVFLDANENPYPNGFNRYPDPHQKKLKNLISNLKGIDTQKLFLGNGSDEAIDLIFRIFCDPGIHNALSIAPTYGMYKVSANINNVKVKEVDLGLDFEFSAQNMLAACDDQTRVIFLCSPNNPTGNILNSTEVISLLDQFKGIVVIDEAYIDFADTDSYITMLDQFQNLVVLQTLSKAWGLAGLRLGLAIASPLIIGYFAKVKYPYNINEATQQICTEYLQAKAETVKAEIEEIISQRKELSTILPTIACVKKVYPSQANFILIEVTDADSIYQMLINKGIVVRNRNSVKGCKNCLRISIGTPEENKILIQALGQF